MKQEHETLKAVKVARELSLTAEAKQLLAEDLDAGHFVRLLADKELFDDAFRFLALWLPIREAVWWACQCCWHLKRPAAAEAEEQALRAAVHWVVEPNEKHRRAAEAAGEAAGLETSAGCIATAAFWSGGSISLPKLPVVEPPRNLASEILAKAVQLALIDAPTEAKPLFVRLALYVADGSNRWDAPLPLVAK